VVISNLKIGTSYFFTPLAEFAKENIRYPLAANLGIAERARKRGQLGHVLGPILFPRAIQIFGIVHRENGNLVTMLLEQLL